MQPTRIFPLGVGVLSFLMTISGLLRAQELPPWDEREVEFYKTFIEQRDIGDYSAAAATAGQWLEHAEKSTAFDKSYYAFVRGADDMDFHEAALSEAWRKLAAEKTSDPNELIKAMVVWLQYLKKTYGTNDPRTIAGQIALADVLKTKGQTAAAIKILQTAEADASKARAEKKDAVPAQLYVSILDRLITLLQMQKQDATAHTYQEKIDTLEKGAGDRTALRSSGGNFNQIQVFFGTDRQVTGKLAPNEWFGGVRAQGITYGTCVVSIPLGDNHSAGKIERPTKWKLEFNEDPTRHVSIVRLDPVPKDEFYASLGVSIRDQVGKSGKKKAFVFVHGFNVTFAAAAWRTAQMAHDLSFEGVPIFFSWASRGSMSDYLTDERTIELSRDSLAEFLVDLGGRTDAEEVYLIAHSMGTQALTKVFPSVYEKLGARKKIFKEIILAAPDIDREIYFKHIAPALGNTEVPVTVYTSQNDKALLTSKTLRGNFPRLGEDAAALAGWPFLESIDASAVQTDFVGHSHFADHKSAILDIHQLISEKKRAAARLGTLSEAKAASGKAFWRVKP